MLRKNSPIRFSNALFIFLKFILVIIVFSTQPVFAEENRFWIEWGRESGRYYETEEVRDDFVHNRSIGVVPYHKKHGWGIVTGLGFSHIVIDDSFTEWTNNSEYKHAIYNESLSIYSSIGLELEILFLSLIGQQVLGLSQNTFSKEFSSIENSSHFINYPETKTYHYYTGSEIIVFARAEDNWLLGVKLGYYDKNIKLLFGETEASLKLPKTIDVIIGKRWGARNGSISKGSVPSGKKNTNNSCLLFRAC